MKFGIIGSGKIGAEIVRKLTKLNHPVRRNGPFGARFAVGVREQHTQNKKMENCSLVRASVSWFCLYKYITLYDNNFCFFALNCIVFAVCYLWAKICLRKLLISRAQFEIQLLTRSVFVFQSFAFLGPHCFVLMIDVFGDCNFVPMSTESWK